MTLVDANVLIDLFMDDPTWSEWSLQQLRDRIARGPLFINDVVYAECSTRFDRVDDFEASLATASVTMRQIPRDALFLAGKAYRQYRRAGGLRTGVLSDFFHRRPCCRREPAVADAGYSALSHLFSDSCPDRPRSQLMPPQAKT